MPSPNPPLHSPILRPFSLANLTETSCQSVLLVIIPSNLGNMPRQSGPRIVSLEKVLCGTCSYGICGGPVASFSWLYVGQIPCKGEIPHIFFHLKGFSPSLPCVLLCAMSSYLLSTVSTATLGCSAYHVTVVSH